MKNWDNNLLFIPKKQLMVPFYCEKPQKLTLFYGDLYENVLETANVLILERSTSFPNSALQGMQ